MQAVKATTPTEATKGQFMWYAIECLKQKSHLPDLKSMIEVNSNN